MTVAELIAHLKTFDQSLLVVYRRYSEQVLLKQDQVTVKKFCEPRADGWVQNKRPDMPSRSYVSFPGN